MTPETIFLIPGEYDGEHGMAWCEDPAPDHYSDPAEAVEYVRKDKVRDIDLGQIHEVLRKIWARRLSADDGLDEIERIVEGGR